MIITKEVVITIHPAYKKRYADLGYDVSQKTVLVKIEDAPKSGRYIVNVICDICNVEKYTNYLSYNTSIEKGGYYACSQKCSRGKVEQTNLKRYGFKAPAQNELIHQKMETTTLERYGVKNPGQSNGVKNKMKKTNLKRYGVENGFSNAEIREKAQATILKRYGVKYASQSEDIKKKKKETSLKNYGVEHPSQNDEIKKKIQITINSISNYHENHTIKCNITREKNRNLKKESTNWKNWKNYKKISDYYFKKLKPIILANWDGYDYYDGEYIKPYFTLKSIDSKYPTIDHIISTKTGFELGIDPKELNILENLVVTKRGKNSSKGSKILDISKLDMFELNSDYVADVGIINDNRNRGDEWCITFKDGTNIYIKNMTKYCRENHHTYDRFIKGKKYGDNIISVTKIKKP